MKAFSPQPCLFHQDELCGLDAFVAASYGTQQKVSNDMDKAIVSFGESERARMAENMPYKLIALCEDETFHPDIRLAAIEAASNVEGRNAQLSPRHHGVRRLGKNRLKALTVVHNFHVKRPDGTTPAQRFFQAEHGNPFEWLVDNMNYPARPRNARS